MKRSIVALILLTACCAPLQGEQASPSKRESLVWTQLPTLPPARGQEKQIGVAGPFAGVHNDALIVAGGANFPRGLPWETLADGSSPPKVYYKDVFVLVKVKDGGAAETGAGGWTVEGNTRYEWIHPPLKLDQPWSYGASISTPQGLICLGGEWKETDAGSTTKHFSRRVFALTWNPKTRQLEQANKLVAKGETPDEVLPLPPLPRECYGMGGARVGDVIYICGGGAASGATKNFWSLDFTKKKDGKDFAWKELPLWPGPPRFYPIVAAQSDGTDDCLYLFSGRNAQSDQPTELLTDAYKYNPKTEKWSRLPDIALEGEAPRCVMAGTGAASGANHVLIFGGADGKLYLELEALDKQIAAARGAEAEPLRKKKIDILENHPGFSRDVLAFHTITNTWTKVGDLLTGSHVTTVAVKWDKSFVIPSGEIQPGVRSPTIWKARPAKARSFGALNYTVLGIYLLVLVAMGLYFSRRMHSTEDFFKAGQRIPWWAAGISIFGTQLSAITFIAIPAKTFATDWRYFWGNMAIVAIAPFIILLFLPFYRRLNVTTAYEYLEMRFNVVIRALGSVMYMLLQFGRIGIVLYLPSIALSVVTGIDINICIVVMGVLCIFYTVLGGMEAVIWTDVIQVVVLAGGALLCLVLIPFHVPGGAGAVFDIAGNAEKLRLFDFRLNLAEATFFVLFVGGFGQNLVSYGTDQTVIQRYLTTPTEKAAARSIWTNAILAIPASLLFFGLGTVLYAFYKTHPTALGPTLAPPDALFPFYIVTQLPAGVAGLLIAGIFAASMSSLDSSMNSVSAAFTTDFYRRFKREPSERSCLALARWITVIIGVLGTTFALWMAAQPGIKSLWDEFSRLLGLFGGGLGGLFLLAIFTRRTNAAGALIGLLASGAVQFVVQTQTRISLHVWLYVISGIASCFAIGYIASLLIPGHRKPDEGLTIYTLAQKADNV